MELIGRVLKETHAPRMYKGQKPAPHQKRRAIALPLPKKGYKSFQSIKKLIKGLGIRDDLAP